MFYISPQKLLLLSMMGVSLETVSAYAETKKNNHIDDTLIVTANPLENNQEDLILPTLALEGEELLFNTRNTLGETLSGQAGIHSTSFGPNVARPVIRGLDGDQIILLQNGVSNFDASSTSLDHNIAIDPLALDRIEVVKGPAALLYGSRSIGGVVNMLDNRIPAQRVGTDVTGMVDGRLNSINNERSGSILLEGDIQDVSWHINGFNRRTGDTDIPAFARTQQLRQSEPLEEGKTEERGSLNNSYLDSAGGSIGVSKHFDAGYLGVAYTRYESDYGIVGHKHLHAEEEEEEEHHEEEHEDHADTQNTPAADDVILQMRQNRFDIAGQYKKPNSLFKKIDYKTGISDYRHEEIDAGTVGTIFTNKGYDNRLEMTHQDLGIFKGMIGTSYAFNDFSALGAEAFLPSSETQNMALFALEETTLGDLKISLAGRGEHQETQRIASEHFGTGHTRNDMTGSGSVGFAYPLAPQYQATFSQSYNQRAPNAQELYAGGVHLATGQYEQGNMHLDVQKSLGSDLGFKKTKGRLTGGVNFFYNHFWDFISINPTGIEDSHSHAPIFSYAGVPAQMYGAELQADYVGFDNHNGKLIYQMRGDYLQARNRQTNHYLPRMAPARMGGGIDYHYDKYHVTLDNQYVFEQNKTAPFETPTDAYVMTNLGFDYSLDFTKTQSVAYVQTTNLFNQEARNHVSFLKDRAPLAGRSVMVGVRSAF